MVLLKCTFQEVSCTLPQMFYLDSLYCLQDTTVWYEVAGILMPVPHFFFFLDFSTTLSFTTVSYNLGCCYNQIINGVRYSSVVLINQSVRLECKGVTTQTLRQDHRNSMARILLEIILLILAFLFTKIYLVSTTEICWGTEVLVCSFSFHFTPLFFFSYIFLHYHR